MKKCFENLQGPSVQLCFVEGGIIVQNWPNIQNIGLKSEISNFAVGYSFHLIGVTCQFC